MALVFADGWERCEFPEWNIEGVSQPANNWGNTRQPEAQDNYIQGWLTNHVVKHMHDHKKISFDYIDVDVDTDKEMHTIAITAPQDGTYKVYVNGNLVQSETVTKGWSLFNMTFDRNDDLSRQKGLFIGYNTMLEMFQDYAMRVLPEFVGLPKDARVFSVHQDHMRAGFFFHIHSMEFDKVQPGHEIPILNMTDELGVAEVVKKEAFTKQEYLSPLPYADLHSCD